MVAIDISYSQSTNIDFVTLRANGVDTVIMKAGGSNTGSRYVDSKYRYFQPRARAAGMRIGHYWFNGYGDPAGDADFFVNNLYDYRPGDLIALDCESEGSMPYWGPGQANAFRDRVKARLGVTCDMYMSSSVTRAQNWSSTVAGGSKLWVAQYGTNNAQPQGAPNIAYWPTYKLWQFTSNAVIPGYAGRLDSNIVNEAQWASNNSVPIVPKKFEDIEMYVKGATNPQVYAVFTDANGHLRMRACSGDEAAFANKGNLVIEGGDDTTIVNLATAAGYPNVPLPNVNAQVPALTPDQITSLANQISSKITAGATKAEVTAIVNGAVVNLAQDNANQTATLKGLTFKAQ